MFEILVFGNLVFETSTLGLAISLAINNAESIAEMLQSLALDALCERW